MTTEELMINYSPIGDVISLVCSMMILFLIMEVLYFTKDKKFMFMEMALCCIFIASATNLVFDAILQINAPVVLIFILRDIYHFGLILCLYCFIAYMKEMLDVKGKFAEVAIIVTRVMLVTALVFEVASPFTHFGFTYKDGLWYDPLVSPYTVFYVYAVVSFTVMLTFYADRLIRPVRACLVMVDVLVVGIMTFQGFLNINSYNTFTYMLPVLVVMIMLHSKPYDAKTGALSVSGFESFVKRTVGKKISSDYMVLKLNFKILDVLPDELGKGLNSFWRAYFKNALLFNLESDLFVLAIPRDKKNSNTEEKIKELTEKAFDKYYSQYQIPYKVIGLFNIDFVETEADIVGMIQYLLSKMEENTIELVSEKKRDELRLFKKIKENLADIEKKGDLDDERVLVYCQPIKNVKTGKYDSAEALMRMTIPEKGMIFPDMFIPLAESYNYIHSLTRIMLNKVCRFIKEMEEEGYNFKRISVNFAASEIIADDFSEEILSIIRNAGVEPEKIGIELTESQTETDFMIAKERMATLKNAGMTLYLDDVGTGYSNLDRVVKYDVDVVKFDRFFILEAEKDEKVIKMMKHLSEAFRDINYELLYEGIETEKNQELCVSCGADYLQGYMYSKPVPIDKLREFFEK